MKKLLSLILAAIVVCTAFASCSTLEKNDKGAIVTMYLAEEIYNYDPAVGFTDTATAKILSLMFEGLTVLDEEGNWKKGMMDSYEYIKPAEEGGTYRLQVTLRETKWSDGRTVQANDFVYAWKRIMEPTFKCEAASLLYDLKNAREIKMGDVTVDDLGVSAVETYVLEMEFTKDINLDEFFKTCASVALVPLREDKVYNNDDWAKRASSMVTNGPFDVRKMTYGQQLNLERSSYYYRDTESNQALDKYVIPYRLIVMYSHGDAAAQLAEFEANNLFYLGDIALSARGDYAKKAEVTDSAITSSLYFDTTNDLFKNAKVRKALSLALDREAIAEKLVFAKAATGFIPNKVNDAEAKGSFREVGGDILASSAKVDEAKSLLKEAGVTSGSFNLSVRDHEVDVAIAEAVAEAWNSLGFKVTVKKLGGEAKQNAGANQSVVYNDLYAEAFAIRNFDVILVDYNMLAPSAFAALAPFASQFSGNGVDMLSENYDVIGHITGYASEKYDEIIEKAYAAKDSKERTAALHEAEAMLLDDMPVIPVVFQQDAFVVGDAISGVKSTYWGRNFKDMKMKNYMEYKESIQAVLDENEAEVAE